MSNIQKNDRLYHLTLLGGKARALIAESTALCERAREIHNTSRVATAALGRLITQTVMMGTDLKHESDSVTCSIKGGGPIGMLLAVAKGDGTVKGYVENPEVDLPRVNEKLPVGDAVGRNGFLTVIRDLGLKEPYTGKVRLMSGEIAEDFAYYYTLSEQLPSLISLGTLVAENVVSAGGLMISMLPGADEEAIGKIEARGGLFKEARGTIQEFGLAAAVDKLFSGLDAEIVLEKEIGYRCDCSKVRVERALLSLGQAELSTLILEDQGAEIDCHFCGNHYAFATDDLKELLKEAIR